MRLKKKKKKKSKLYIHNLFKILMRKQGFYFFKNDSNFGNHNCREVRHEYRDWYSLARDVTSDRKRHGHGEGFRLTDVHLRLLDIYRQLKTLFHVVLVLFKSYSIDSSSIFAHLILRCTIIVQLLLRIN